ncbi:MAG: radical SAM protein [Coxiellaceae bacterium]|jgi:MoaA/NifB/PqqE/SkfB family radical SAM enzyme|nr:radical SAM protein [Coxiellaceae bacterium]
MKILCNYYVTLRCNSRCKFCNIWQLQHKSQEPTIEEIKNNLKDLKKLGIKVIDFTGGEPLLYPFLREALVVAKKLGFYTTVTTNCTLYPQYAGDLKGLINVLYFSLHSHQESVHNEITGINSHQKVITSIELAKKLHQKIYLLHTTTNENLVALPTIINFAQKNRCVLSINPCFSYFGNQGLTVKLAEQLIPYRNEPYVMLNLALLKFIISGGNQTTKPVCRAVKNVIVISPDNCLLLPCYHHTIHKIKINNNLFELQNSKIVDEIAKQMGKYEFCQGCKINCYMRASLFKKYPYLSLVTWIKNLREFSRS